ncbi:hypothetical protein B296_00022441 [Ensete ventricosum]|uniref:Uncharacterized protein n=1 Tax=Ensete ventricosum TaxID=4639 RepID=A0A427AE63_ENSVE|nr:hypothetical protein B296_00022441 [Ensete ventricosum]
MISILTQVNETVAFEPSFLLLFLPASIKDGKGTILIELDVLMQERLLGVALGAAFTASVVLGNRRAIHRSISDNRPVYYEVRWI